MDRISHLEDQWRMDDGFLVNDGVSMCGGEFVMIWNEIAEFWMKGKRYKNLEFRSLTRSTGPVPSRSVTLQVPPFENSVCRPAKATVV